LERLDTIIPHSADSCKNTTTSNKTGTKILIHQKLGGLSKVHPLHSKKWRLRRRQRVWP